MDFILAVRPFTMQLHGALGLIAITVIQSVSGAIDIEVNPLPIDIGVPPTLYFAIGGPLQINCTASIEPHENICNNVSTLSLSFEKEPRNVIQCICKLCPGTETPNNAWAGSGEVVCPTPSNGTMQCTYAFASIKDGNYSCVANNNDGIESIRSFMIERTKEPDRLYLSYGDKDSVTVIDVVEGVNASLDCTASYSKPTYLLSWDMSDINLTSESHTRRIENRSTTFITASRNMHEKKIRCTGEPPSKIPTMSTKTASAIMNVTYGPDDINATVELDRRETSIDCPLTSNPSMTFYNWTQDGLYVPCTGKTCNITPTESTTDLTCSGRNPIAAISAIATIEITWRDPPTSTEKPLPGLSEGAIAAIVIAILVVAILVIAIPTIYWRHKHSKRHIESSNNPTELVTYAMNGDQVYAKPYKSKSKKASMNPGSTDSTQPGMLGSSDVLSSAVNSRKQSNTEGRTSGNFNDSNTINNSPRSRNPIALQDVPLEDLAPNPLYASVRDSHKD